MKRYRTRTRAGPAGVIRLGVAVALAGAGLIAAAMLPMSGVASRGGDNNKGDVFVDTVSTNTGPSGQMTPHMVCTGAQQIYIYGKDLSAASGTFTLTGQPPTGKKVAMQRAWTFSAPPGTAQVIATVDIPTLIANAKANGDTPHFDMAKGFEYKFKLDVGLKNAKQKVFWVTPCAAITTPPPTPTPTPTPTATPAGSVSGSSTSQAGAAAVSTPVTGAEAAGIAGLTLLVSGAALTVLGLARRRADA